MGPCIVSLWTHPDVGIGTFFVLVKAAPGNRIPQDLKFDIGVLPLSGRLAEQRYSTSRSIQNEELRFDASIPFDKMEQWRVNLYMRSASANQMATTTVEVTPPGLGAWDLLFFSWPFFGFGAIWFIAMKRRWKRRMTASVSTRDNALGRPKKMHSG